MVDRQRTAHSLDQNAETMTLLLDLRSFCLCLVDFVCGNEQIKFFLFHVKHLHCLCIGLSARVYFVALEFCGRFLTANKSLWQALGRNCISQVEFVVNIVLCRLICFT